MKAIGLATALAAAVSLSSAASGAVRYEFTAFTAINDVIGSFTLVSPDFLSSGAFAIPVSDLESCTGSPTTCIAGQLIISDTSFIDASQPDFADVIGFSFLGSVAFEANVYYFEDGALGTVGTHDTVFLTGLQDGQLIVSLVRAVPEPASWAMMIAGFAGIGGGLRRRARLSPGYYSPS